MTLAEWIQRRPGGLWHGLMSWHLAKSTAYLQLLTFPVPCAEKQQQQRWSRLPARGHVAQPWSSLHR
jgi:hypothetical protein